MAERPILFSGPMARAILDGNKTQTRRVVNRLQGFGSITEFQRTQSRGYDWIFRNKRMLWNDITNQRLFECSPYGHPGDRLWVRETWAARPDQDHLPPIQCDDTGLWWKASLSGCETGYAACNGKWRPSIHMPRWASRITLEITNIRVERVQEISIQDQIAEGFSHDGHKTSDSLTFGGITENFKSYWDSINGTKVKKSGRTTTATRDYPWSLNPWVWVIEFKRV